MEGENKSTIESYYIYFYSESKFPKYRKYVADPIHGISCGDKAPQIVNAVIEIPQGSKSKFEVDKSSGFVKLDRVLFSAVHYPFHYGYIPRTLCEDGDPLDILALCSVDVPPMCLLRVRVLGVMHMIDGGDADDKILGVCEDDISLSKIQTLEDVPPYTMEQITRFFADYKILEKKKVQVEEFKGQQEAYKVVEDSQKMYERIYPDSKLE